MVILCSPIYDRNEWSESGDRYAGGNKESQGYTIDLQEDDK